MDRRAFLKLLGVGAAVTAAAAVAPKIIFDLGAKKYADSLIYQDRLYFSGINPAYENAPYEEVIIMGRDPYTFTLDQREMRTPAYSVSEIQRIDFLTDRVIEFPQLYPRRFNLVGGIMKEIQPFTS